MFVGFMVNNFSSTQVDFHRDMLDILLLTNQMILVHWLIIILVQLYFLFTANQTILKFMVILKIITMDKCIEIGTQKNS